MTPKWLRALIAVAAFATVVFAIFFGLFTVFYGVATGVVAGLIAVVAVSMLILIAYGLARLIEWVDP